MNHFKRKLSYWDILEKKQGAEELKINLGEELRYLGRWISEYEDILKFKTANVSSQIKENLVKQIGGDEPTARFFSYQPLFEAYNYEKLQTIAKQVFISPIHNWSIFNALKKRLENAFEIKKDLSLMLKELESKKQKMLISRLQPYLNQYWVNCRVKGLPEIDRMIHLNEQSKQIINDLTADIQNSHHLLSKDKMEEAIKKLQQFKAQHSKSRFNFEEKEEILRQGLWIFEGRLLKMSHENLKD